MNCTIHFGFLLYFILVFCCISFWFFAVFCFGFLLYFILVFCGLHQIRLYCLQKVDTENNLCSCFSRKYCIFGAVKPKQTPMKQARRKAH